MKVVTRENQGPSDEEGRAQTELAEQGRSLKTSLFPLHTADLAAQMPAVEASLAENTRSEIVAVIARTDLNVVKSSACQYTLCGAGIDLAIQRFVIANALLRHVGIAMRTNGTDRALVSAVQSHPVEAEVEYCALSGHRRRREGPMSYNYYVSGTTEADVPVSQKDERGYAGPLSNIVAFRISSESGGFWLGSHDEGRYFITARQATPVGASDLKPLTSMVDGELMAIERALAEAMLNQPLGPSQSLDVLRRAMAAVSVMLLERRDEHERRKRTYLRELVTASGAEGSLE